MCVNDEMHAPRCQSGFAPATNFDDAHLCAIFLPKIKWDCYMTKKYGLMFSLLPKVIIDMVKIFLITI